MALYNTGLSKMFKSSPKKKFLGLFLHAGHGMMRDGVQCFVLNQFQKKLPNGQGYYYLQSVEIDIRNLSKQCKNAYIVAIFACCREIFIKDMHCTCFGKTKEEATAAFDNLEATEKQLEEQKLNLEDQLAKAVAELKELKQFVGTAEEQIDQEDEEPEETKKDQLRGGSNLTQGEEHPNFMFLLGSEPRTGIRADSKLIFDALLILEQLYDKDTLIVEFPEVFRKF